MFPPIANLHSIKFASKAHMIALINIADQASYSHWVLLIVLLMICLVDQNRYRSPLPLPHPHRCIFTYTSLMSAMYVLQLCDNFILFALYILL